MHSNSLSEPDSHTDNSIGAKRSLLIFFLYYIVQFLTGLIIGVIISVSFIVFTGHRPSEEQFKQFARSLDPYILLVSSVLSALFLIYFTIRYASGVIRDRSNHGFAVHPGNRYQLIMGFLYGLLTAVVYALVMSSLYPLSPDTSFGPITQMAFSDGVARYTWFLLALILAPPVEEYIFRGILFAGFTRSFGVLQSAVITTVIFLLIHVSEYLYYPPAMAGILALGILTVVLRIRTGSLGPPVAAHAGYNLFITTVLLNTPR